MAPRALLVIATAAGLVAGGCASKGFRPPMVAECANEMHVIYPARCVLDVYSNEYLPADCVRNDHIPEIEVECPLLCSHSLCYAAVRDRLCAAGARAGSVVAVLEETEVTRYRVEPLVCGGRRPAPPPAAPPAESPPMQPAAAPAPPAASPPPSPAPAPTHVPAPAAPADAGSP